MHTQHTEMRAPRSKRARRLSRLVAMTESLVQTLEIVSMAEDMDELESNEKKTRSTLLPRERRSWVEYIKPMLGDGTFKRRFRMDHEHFVVLVDLVRPALQRNEKMGALRNGAVPVEFQVALTLRWLAGASMYEGMDGHVIARSTAYQISGRVINALNACPELDCRWPKGVDVAKAASGFKDRSTFEVIKKCAGAMDGLFIRMTKLTRKDTTEPNNYFSGHKKGFGMNFQVGE